MTMGGDMRQVVRFMVIVVVVMGMLAALSAWGGYMMGRDAAGGVTFGGERKTDPTKVEAKGREGFVLGGLIGALEGLVIGVAIGWGDLYFSRKKRIGAQ
ncbi:hypothetical protein [Poriferisphaera corsica]|nr:hypothetical protein [Poriferisphaera corsica]